MNKLNGKQIKELRKNLGLSQREFAKLMGVGKDMVYFWETEHKIPHYSKLQQMENLK